MSKNKKYYPVLENLFGSKIRVKTLKFLFRNYPTPVGVRELAVRIQESPSVVKKELAVMQRIGLIKKY